MIPRVFRIAIVACGLLVGGLVAARTAASYVAADGFGAPERVAQLPSQTAAAVALDDGTPVVYWYDPTGVYRRNLTGEPDERRIVAERGLRGLAAVTVDGDPAVLQVVRDFQTGRNAHRLAWRGDERVIADALDVLPVALAPSAEGPAWLVRRGASGRGLLTLDGWNREALVVRETDVSLAGYDLAVAPDGTTWVAWLEGTTERSALGVVSNWSAYVVRVDGAGAVGPALNLGKALHRGEVDVARVGVGSDGSVRVLWPREDGVLVGTTLEAKGGMVPLADAPRSDLLLGSGIAVAVAEGAAYWADADRVLERRLEPGTTTRAVLWAPHTIQAGEGLSTPSGELFLTWYGGAQRGTYAVYAAGTGEPFEPGWQDHMAATMGWDPWNLWSEALGQLLTSLLAGVLITMALSPLLWLSSALAVRYGSIHDGTWVGIGLGSAVVLLGVGLARLRLSLPPATIDALFGVWWHMAVALVVAGAVTWALRRRRDTEPLLGTMLAAASCTGLATTILAFATYQAWATSWVGFL